MERSSRRGNASGSDGGAGIHPGLQARIGTSEGRRDRHHGRGIAGLTLLFVLGCSSAGSRFCDAESDLQAAGRVLYGRYCASCHGGAGKGDGPVASALGQRPTDLTRIAVAHGGRFPFLATVAAIDGTRDVRAHGVSEMPVWGEVFAPRGGWSPEAVAEARGKVVLITEYLRSIQAP